VLAIAGQVLAAQEAPTPKQPGPPPQPAANQPPAAAAGPVATPAPAEEEGLQEVVVTGYRSSLNQALADKRVEVGAVDSIRAEDIADFPDLNLAESVQRIPGVSIERDAGEGRRISVRGLGPQFTRIRINGMEAMATTGGADSSNGTNRTRQFDFNVFASELFNAITVRKTASAEVEEGSLGATVDLRAARPFDYNGFTFVTSLQGGYNDLVDKVNPRGALVLSDTFFDGKFGALVSAAYSERDLLEEGTSTVLWQNGGTFGALAPGYSSAPTLPQLNNAFRPRIPRYDTYQHHQERLGVTSSLQFQPTDSTLFSLDALYSKLDATREEAYLESPVFSSSPAATGINEVNPTAALIDGTNTLIYGAFNNVDIRSEFRHDDLTTEFKQATLEGEHAFTDAFKIHALAGRSESNHDNPVQTTLIFDALNVNGYSYDFRNNNRVPAINYGTAQVTQPSTWTLSQIRLRPQTADNTFNTGTIDLQYKLTDRFQYKVGGEYKKYEFQTTELRRTNGTTANQEAVLPGAVLSQATNVSGYSQLVSLAGGLGTPAGTPTTWLVPDIDKAAQLFGLYDQTIFPLGIQPALGNNNGVQEEDAGAFLQTDFTVDVAGRALRGNMGVRYVQTDQTSNGYTFTSGSPLFQTVKRDYTDTLPSLNLAYDLTDTIVLRAAAAKVMTRPNLNNLNPGASVSISGSSKTVTAGNPLLDPLRANAFDLAFEWYFTKEALVSTAFFYKDIKSFVQTIRTQGDFSTNTLGLPNSVALAVCGVSATDPTAASCLANWQFSQPANTPGGDLKGVEVAYQQPFSFLPSFLKNFGTILNYTFVDSKIQYLGVVNNQNAVVATDQLTGLSKNAANATLYYDNHIFSARVSAAYRSKYITGIPGRFLNDIEGTKATTNLDFSSSLALSKQFDVTLEALNLTDEFQDQYVDSVGDRLSVYHHTGRQFFFGARFKY
jgi:TonB-dependent receptor